MAEKSGLGRCPKCGYRMIMGYIGNVIPWIHCSNSHCEAKQNQS